MKNGSFKTNKTRWKLRFLSSIARQRKPRSSPNKSRETTRSSAPNYKSCTKSGKRLLRGAKHRIARKLLAKNQKSYPRFKRLELHSHSRPAPLSLKLLSLSRKSFSKSQQGRRVSWCPLRKLQASIRVTIKIDQSVPAAASAQAVALNRKSSTI